MRESIDHVDSQLRTAFADHKWPYAEVPEPNPTLPDMEETLQHIYRFDDGVKNFYLPKLLSAAIIPNFSSASRRDWLRRLIAFLDVNFETTTPATDAPLKQTRFQSFASYNKEQSRAILSWLGFVKKNFSNEVFADELGSAIRYWQTRTDSSMGSNLNS